ncbi:MAG: hypothetical protein ABSA45_02580 [Verrucomicrobiota bacterium]
MTPPPEKNHFHQAAWLVAILMTMAAMWLHFYFLLHAGGLWRDEVQVVNLAGRHSLSDMAGDSFPALMPLLICAWSALGPGQSDPGLRLLGVLTGLGIPAALWFAAWTARRSPPLLGLALLALNTIVIFYGDSLRAYGLGSALIALTAGTMWAFLKRPSWQRAGFLTAASILSVQALYQNAVLVAGICLGAWTVCWRLKNIRAAVKIFLAGLAAAASLLPYWKIVIGMPAAAAPLRWGFMPAVAFTNLDSAVAFPLPQYVYVWMLVALAVVGFGLAAAWRGYWSKSTAPAAEVSAGDLHLFAAVILLAGFAGFIGFLWFSALPTQPWYFLPMISLVAVCFELGLPPARRQFRAAFLGCIIATALIAIPFAQRDLNYRFTNVNLLAPWLAAEAAPDDLIIVTPWSYGISFERYFKGSTPWTTLPPLADHSAHRFDLVKAQMEDTNAIQPVLDRAAATLRAGRRVWVVGWMSPPVSNSPPPVPLPPPPLKFTGWLDSPYSMSWAAQTAWFLNHHSLQFERVDHQPNLELNFYEAMQLFAAVGWKDSVPKTNRP